MRILVLANVNYSFLSCAVNMTYTYVLRPCIYYFQSSLSQRRRRSGQDDSDSRIMVVAPRRFKHHPWYEHFMSSVLIVCNGSTIALMDVSHTDL